MNITCETLLISRGLQDWERFGTVCRFCRVQLHKGGFIVAVLMTAKLLLLFSSLEVEDTLHLRVEVTAATRNYYAGKTLYGQKTGFIDKRICVRQVSPLGELQTIQD